MVNVVHQPPEPHNAEDHQAQERASDKIGVSKIFKGVVIARERTQLLERLRKMQVPLNDVASLMSKVFKDPPTNTKYNPPTNPQDTQIQEFIMRKKITHARKDLKKLVKLKKEAIAEVKRTYGEKSRKTKSIMKKAEAKNDNLVKKIRKKYNKKIETLKEKKKKRISDEEEREKEERYKVPDKIEEYNTMRDFRSKDKAADRIQEKPKNLDIMTIGCQVSEEERSLLSLPPDFCLFRRLQDEDFELQQEIMATKLRYEKMNETPKNENDNEAEEEKPTEEEEEIVKMEEARMRLPYHGDTKQLSMGRRRATDCVGNAMVHLPKAMGIREESEVLIRADTYKEAFTNYKAKECNKKGDQRTNLSPEQARGLKSLQKRIADGEIICCQTDKTGRFSIVSMESYINMGKAHTKDDKEISMEEVKKIERITNGHTSSMIKILGVGAQWGHQDRIRKSAINKGCNVASMYTVVKDHKPPDPDTGLPKTRPIVASKGGFNLYLQNILSDVLEPVAEEVEGSIEACSTEDFLNKVDQLNESWKKNINSNNLTDAMILGSDAESLYPSLKKEETAAQVYKEVVNSKVEFQDIQWKEAARYLAINCEPWQHKHYKVQQYIPRRVNRKGVEPGMTSRDVMDPKVDADSQWTFRNINPSPKECKILLAACLAEATKFIFTSHV